MSLNNMPEKNAHSVKSGRIKAQRNKTRYCKTHGCGFFTLHTHCSGCERNLPKKMAYFRKKLECVLNILARDSAGIVEDTVLGTLRNIRQSSKLVLFKAKDVAHLFKGDYQLSTMQFKDFLMSPADRVLVRVVDYWNLHEELGFNSTIQCYWNTFRFDNRGLLNSQLYAARQKLFNKRSLKKVLGPEYEKFILIWHTLLKSTGPVPNPSDAVQLTTALINN